MTRATMLRSLAPGRRVRCNVKGRQFWAVIVEPQVEGQGWIVKPDSRNVTWFHVTNRQIEQAEQVWTPATTQRRRP